MNNTFFVLFHLFWQVLPIVYASCCPCFLSFVSPKEKTGKAVHFVGFAAASGPVMLCIPVGGKSPLRIWLNIWSFWAELRYFKSFCKGYHRWIASSKACYTVHFTFRPVVTENILSHKSIALDPCVLLKRGQMEFCPNFSVWSFVFLYLKCKLRKLSRSEMGRKKICPVLQSYWKGRRNNYAKEEINDDAHIRTSEHDWRKIQMTLNLRIRHFMNGYK